MHTRALRETILLSMIIRQRGRLLFEVVDAMRAPRQFTGTLHSRQQQANQDADDRDHDQQFNERESTAPFAEVEALVAVHR